MRRVFCLFAVTGIVVTGLLVSDAGAAPVDARSFSSQEATLAAPAVACSTPLKLYNGTSLTGTSVSIYTRGLWIDLSTVAFDNQTSSFKVGACAIELAAGAGGTGSHYTRCLSAGCTENSMLSGWNNTVSSAYLH
jgi:hypothetical protein